MSRVSKIVSHLQKNPTNATVYSPEMPSDAQILTSVKVIQPMLDKLENRMIDKTIDLPGPLNEMSEDQFMFESQKSLVYGQNMILWEGWTKKYGKNIVMPMTITPKGAMPYRDWLVIISDPEDVSRILRKHIKKSDIYGVAFLGEGVLSTRDNELWDAQRKHLQEAFLPNTVLSFEVFPKSLARAKFAARERMPRLFQQQGSNVVEMNQFLLHEAMAQLQLALIGQTQEEMERFNVPLRNAHENSLKFKFGDLDKLLAMKKANRKTIFDFSNEVLTNCPAGPLGKRLVDNCPFGVDDPKIKRDTVSTFNFAGYDTTGNLMTWTIYELSKHQDIQKRVRDEIDSVFEKHLQTREMQYKDLLLFPVLSRVITEVLRLWPSVPNGTFREFECDDEIKGRNGKMIKIPKGTQANIPIWLLHSSEELWGPTVEEFNPDREFLPQEVWNGVALAGWNPQSHRYMPFTAGPRDCVGKNFAQMEARLILIELLRNYEFTLAEPTLSASKTDRKRDERFIATNDGTMSPRNGIFCNLVKRNLI